MKTTNKLTKFFAMTMLLCVFACSSDDNGNTPPQQNTVSATNLSATIDENPDNGEALGTLQATAAQGALSYSITTQTPSGSLSINASTGELTVANNTLFDFETNPTITAEISVSDDISSTTAMATINLSDIKDLIHIHTATVDNSSGNVTVIDHPDLNGNPDAKVVFSHNWNGGTYNDQVTGLWYNGTNWTIFNEDLSNIIEGSTYNIYIVKDGEAMTHIATAANQGSLDSYSILDHPMLNGNPNAVIILSNYWNPNSVYNNHNYSIWYDATGERWIIFTEDLGAIPLDSAFNVLIQGDAVDSFKHQATAANITSNWTTIDHPELNGDPNAKFVFTHNWETSGDSANVILDKVLSLYYTGSNWAIYTEDLTAMPQNISFDIVIAED